MIDVIERIFCIYFIKAKILTLNNPNTTLNMHNIKFIYCIYLLKLYGVICPHKLDIILML